MLSVEVHDLERHASMEDQFCLPDEMLENEGMDDEDPSSSTKVIRFSSGNPRVETTWGLMHLFRNSTNKSENTETLPVQRTEQVCVLAVPGHMTGADFCQFTGAFVQNVKEMRIVRNEGFRDRYSVIMKFDSQESADDFYNHFNGSPFSSLEAEICHVLFIADVQYTNSGEQTSSLPSGSTELPTCPVCLERLDQHVSGILTTVCNHTFHSSCISKWTDSSCPVCRYCQQKYENSICYVCKATQNLWICVICGFVGCGRYQGGHAVRHWKETQHCYSLELETQRVWDYVGDNYVHRLILSKTDGKLVEYNSPCNDHDRENASSCECSRGNEFDVAVCSSKLEAVEYEYNDLMKTQLESQRQYFEGLLADAASRRDAAIGEAVQKAISSKLHKLHAKLEKAEEDNSLLEQLNKCLCDNQEEWKQKFRKLEEESIASLKERDERIGDLEEQVRDLMVYIEAQRTMEGNSEIQEASVMSVSGPKTKNKRVGKATRK